MSDYLFTYLILKLDSIRELLKFDIGLMILLGCMVTAAMMLVSLLCDAALDTDTPGVHFKVWIDKLFRKVNYKVFVAFIAFILFSNVLYVILPSTSQAVLIYFIPKLANTESIASLKDIDPRIAKLIKMKADFWLQEAEKELKGVEEKEDSKY